jgi:oligosaccharide repeat unit polymerase
MNPVAINKAVVQRFVSYFAALFVLVLLFFISDSLIPPLFVVIYWGIGFPFIMWLSGKVRDILHPSGPLLILNFLYSMSAILYYLNNGGMTLYGDIVSAKTFYLFCVASILGEIGIILGTLLAFRSTSEGRSSPLSWKGLQYAIPVMLFMALAFALLLFHRLTFAFNFINPSSYAETALSSRVAIMEADAVFPIIQVFTQIVPMVLLIASAIIMFFHRNPLMKLIGAGLLLANLLTFLLTGSRGGLFFTLCAIAVYFHYRVHRIRAVALVLGMSVSLILLNGVALVRSTSDLAEMRNILISETGGDIFSLFNLGKSGEFLVGMNLMRLIEGISAGESRFSYGISFLDDILCYIPRSVFPNRPLPLSERFVEDFYPGVRDMGGGYGLFFLQDGYWAFGLIGVLISLVAYSWALGRIYLFVKKSFSNSFIVLAYSFAYFPLVVSSPRSGLILSFKAAAMNLIPFLLVAVLAVMMVAIRGTNPNVHQIGGFGR